MNRAQQAYYMEKSSTFANQDSFGDLGLGVSTLTANYKYSIAGGGPGITLVSNQAGPVDATGTINAKSPLKAYVGGVAIGTILGTGEATTLSVLCEGAKAPVNGGPTGQDPITAAETCPSADYAKVK